MHEISGLRFEPLTYKIGMSSATHLTAKFDVGSWKERDLYVSLCVATGLGHSTVCVTGLVV